MASTRDPKGGPASAEEYGTPSKGSWELWFDGDGRVWIERGAFELLTTARIVEMTEKVVIPDNPGDPIEPQPDPNNGKVFYVLGDVPQVSRETVFGIGAESPPCKRHR